MIAIRGQPAREEVTEGALIRGLGDQRHRDPKRRHVLRRGVSNRGTPSDGAILGQLDPTIRN